MGEKEFFERCREVSKAIGGLENPLVVGHYDADGLCSTAIVLMGLRAMGKGYRVKTIRKLDFAEAERLKEEKEIIFVDLGSGFSGIEEFENCVVIDHHQLGERKKEILEVNPHLFGIDGGSEISAAGIAHFVFGIGIDLAIVGALGDMQYPLVGLNRKILEKGIESGEVSCEREIRLFGRVSRPLLQMLLYADEPYLPGLTGNEEACMKFLEDLGIKLKEGEEWRKYAQLSEEEKKRFVSGIIEYLVERGYEESAREIVGEVYRLLKRPAGTELSDASEFSALLNACGRNKRAELGISVCLGEEESLAEAKKLLAVHRKNLRESIEYANRNAEDYGKFLFIDGRGVIEEGIIGIVAGMVYAGKREKPVIAIANEEGGGIKVSSRGTKKLVEKGLNLGLILGESAREVDGVGGGHRIAAGASIEEGNLNEFLCAVGKRIKV